MNSDSSPPDSHSSKSSRSAMGSRSAMDSQPSQSSCRAPQPWPYRLCCLFQLCHWQPLVTGAGLILLAFLVRIVDLDRGLWLDELHTSWTVSGDLSEVPERALAGNQSPLYFLLVWPLVSILGHSEITLRLVSLISGALLTAVVWRVVLKICRSSVAAIFAAGLVAVDPFFIEYSQEARPYALLQMVGVLQIYFFVQINDFDFSRIEQDNQSIPHQRLKARVGLISCAVLGFYLHLTAVLLTVAMLLIYIGRLVWGGNPLTRKHAWRLADFGIIVACCLPLWPSISAVSQRRANWELFVNDASYSNSIAFQLIVYLLPGVVTVAALCVVGNFRSIGKLRRPRADLLVFALCYLVPILLAWVAFKTGIAALYHHRYFLIGWTGAVLFCGVLFGRLIHSNSKAIKSIGFFLIATVYLLSIINNELLQHVIKQRKLEMPFESPWNSAVAHVNEDSIAKSAKDNSVVYSFPNLIEDRLLSVGNRIENQSGLPEYCLFPVRGIYRLTCAQAFAKSTLFRPRFSPQDAATLKESTSVTLMVRGTQDIASDILNEFAQFGFQNDLYFVLKSRTIFPFRGAAGNFIGVFRFEIRH